jgi:hypothetical protein
LIQSEVTMSAYLLILLAVVTRVVPHPASLNFTAVGGSLLYFGARRPLWQLIFPVALLAGSDYYLTTFAYGYPFHLAGYLVTWFWYAAIVVLGAAMLKGHASIGRVLGASALSASSFFLLSNFEVWAASAIYPHSPGGLAACYLAAVPFYRNDLISTALVATLAFGAPQIVNWFERGMPLHRPAAS